MPQVKRSLGLIYSVNPYGADHCSSDPDSFYEEGTEQSEQLAELGLLEPRPAAELGPEKVRYAHYTQWMYSANNSLCVCMFVWGPSWQLYSSAQLTELIRAATGWNYNLFELAKLGERTVNMQRAFNAREGFTVKDDYIAPKMSQPLKGGDSDGAYVPDGQYQEAQQLYFRMCGWTENGVPTRSKLEELGIGWVADLIKV
jgi:aldehyde:ferredoxin oxidoreductase